MPRVVCNVWRFLFEDGSKVEIEVEYIGHSGLYGLTAREFFEH